MENIKPLFPQEEIMAFCQEWDITELAIFGSALRDDFSARSDIDVLVSFADTAEITLLDLAQMQIELERLFQRPVDLVEKAALRNPYRCQEILATARTVYANS